MSGLTPGVRNGGSVRQSPASAPATNAATIMVSTAGVESYVELAANTVLARSSSGAAAAKAVTDFGFSLLDDPDAATARTTLGITSASPGGSSGQVQYNNSGTFDGAAGAVWSASSPNFTITAQASAHTGLRAKAAASHGSTTPIFDVVNSSNTQLFAVLPSRVVVGTDITLDLPASTDGAGATGRNTIRTGYGAMYLRSGNTDNVVIAAGAIQIAGGVTNNTLQAADRGGSLTLSVIDHFGGTNTAGQPVKICTGRSTGNALPGTIDLQVSPPGASGSSFNTLTTVAQVDGATTSGGTRFLLWDIDAGSLKRVLLGANDSGGTGYKMLRVAN